MTWFWISKGKLNYCQSKVCVSCWFFSRWLFQFKFLVEEANNWIEEPVYRLVMWEAERGNTELYTFHIRAKSNGVQAWNRRKRGYMNKVIEEEIWCTVSFFFKLSKAEMINRERKPSRGSDEYCYGCVLRQHDSWYKRTIQSRRYYGHFVSRIYKTRGNCSSVDTAVIAARN